MVVVVVVLLNRGNACDVTPAMNTSVLLLLLLTSPFSVFCIDSLEPH